MSGQCLAGPAPPSAPEPERDAAPRPDVTASILVPAYNAAGFLDRAIGSALQQTCQAIEVVVVDDGSTDNTQQVLDRWTRRDPRLIALRHAQNQGVSAARNTAIDHARGRWLSVLDADDAFLPERIERLVALAEAARADLFADGLMQVDFQTGSSLGPSLPEEAMAGSGPTTLIEMVRRDRMDQPGGAKFGYLKPIIRRDFLMRTGLRYRPEIGVGEDFLLYFECVAAGARFHLTPHTWYLYSVRVGSVSSGHWGPLQLSAANRRMLRVARHSDAVGHSELVGLLRRRQAAIDNYSFDLAIESRRPLAALRYARYAEPRHMWHRLRRAAGVAWGRCVRTVAAVMGRAAR